MPFVQKLANIDKGARAIQSLREISKANLRLNDTAQRFMDWYIGIGCSAERRLRHDFTNFIEQMVFGYQILFQSSQKFRAL
jgi:hypothetical protein